VVRQARYCALGVALAVGAACSACVAVDVADAGIGMTAAVAEKHGPSAAMTKGAAAAVEEPAKHKKKPKGTVP